MSALSPKQKTLYDSMSILFPLSWFFPCSPAMCKLPSQCLGVPWGLINKMLDALSGNYSVWIMLLITRVCLGHFQAEVDDLGRILVPCSSFLAAEARAEDRQGESWSWSVARGCCCAHDLAGSGQLCPLEVAVRETAALLCLAGWRGSWHFLVPVWELRQCFLIWFFYVCIYFWPLSKGIAVPSRYSINWNLSAQHTSSAAQA